VTTQQPRKSAAIANSVAEAFLANQVDAHVDEAKRAGDWFRERLDQLRRQSGDASRAVEEYRSRNNLLAANGQLVSDQQLTQLNNDIALAAADLVRKQARYDNLKRLIDSGNTDANIAEAQEVATIAQLRHKLTDTTKRYSDTVARVGPNHQLSIRLRNDIADYKKQTFEELRNVLAGFESELAIARERQDALTRQLVQSTAVTTTANSSLVQLRQLEQEATAIRALYQSFLQRYQETVQQESFPLNDARVISDASAPLQASEPRMVLFAAAGILLGLGAGVGIGAFRELSDRAFRTANQVETDLGIDVFGLLPNIDGPSKAGTSGAGPGLRDYTTPSEGALGQYATKHPFSSYSETLRAVKMGIDGSLKIDRAKVVGIVSSMPREGKSTVSLNLASLLALQGNRVALIDADLREAGLTKLAGLKPTLGLGDVLLEQTPISQIMVLDPVTGLMIFPATVKHNFFLSGDLISSPNMVALLKSLSKVYDYVIVDLPPIGPVVDARVAAELLDAVVMVVEWGNVPRRFVRNALASSPAVREKLIGAVLNKVEVDKLKSYEPYGLDKKQEEVFNRYYR
jgi:succinoglycan biosynthesis transport protein ExoP